MSCLVCALVPLLQELFSSRIFGSFVDLNLGDGPTRVAQISMDVAAKINCLDDVASGGGTLAPFEGELFGSGKLRERLGTVLSSLC